MVTQLALRSGRVTRRAGLVLATSLLLLGAVIAAPSADAARTPRPLIIKTTALRKVAVVGRSYHAKLHAKGGTKPYVWETMDWVSGPDWQFTLDADGTFSGLSTQLGVATFQVTITDSSVPPMSATGYVSVTDAAPGGVRFR